MDFRTWIFNFIFFSSPSSGTLDTSHLTKKWSVFIFLLALSGKSCVLSTQSWNLIHIISTSFRNGLVSEILHWPCQRLCLFTIYTKRLVCQQLQACSTKSTCKQVWSGLASSQFTETAYGNFNLIINQRWPLELGKN